MKKINNNGKFRGNAVYSLNYKFDSVSPAGKFSGTALDLIKKYNELAKEAQNNGDYVGMEVFRQYAEHYRKIVTEINERKFQTRGNQNNSVFDNGSSAETEEANADEQTAINNNLVETQGAEPAADVADNNDRADEAQNGTPKMRRRRNFTVIDMENETSADQKAEDSAEIKTENSERKTQHRKYVRKNKPQTAEEA